MLSPFVGIRVSQASHQSVSVVAVPSAWADSCVVAEAVENMAKH